MAKEKMETFVLEGEQPYKLPENWQWVTLHSFSNIRTGKKDANYGNEDGKYPFFFFSAEPINADGYSFDEKAIILAGNGDIGNISLFEGKFEAYQRTYVINIKNNWKAEYVYFFFKYRWVDFNHDKMFGTAIPYIRLGNLQHFPIPVPPLGEQQRIVDRIESLFTKLDEAKEKAQAVVDEFEDRKAAILHKAFTGELTAEWRKKAKCPEWRSGVLSDHLLRMETRKPAGAEFLYIDIDSIDNKTQKVREPKLVASHQAPSRASRAVHCGDTVFSMVRPYLKNIAYIDEPLSNCIASTGFYVCSPKPSINSKYLFYLLCSKDVIDYLMQFMKGDNSPSIRASDLLDMPVFLPSINEQTFIVNVIMY